MVVVNPSGEIVLLNAQAEKQFGYHREELVGQKLTNIIPEGFAERLIADGTRSAAEALAQQIDTGIELIGLRKDKSEFPIAIMLSPLDSAEGILVTAAIRDISVRRAAENQLALMEGRYRGLLEAAPDAMVVVNQQGEIVLLNVQAEKQFGYRRDELIGQRMKNIIPAGFAERLIADGLRSVEDAMAQQIGTGIELTALRKNGSEFPIELMLSPLESAEGPLVTAAIRDITKRKVAEANLLYKVEELNRSNEELGQFAYSSPSYSKPAYPKQSSSERAPKLPAPDHSSFRETFPLRSLNERIVFEAQNRGASVIRAKKWREKNAAGGGAGDFRSNSYGAGDSGLRACFPVGCDLSGRANS
jgi:PAS domain S-box-containing protein